MAALREFIEYQEGKNHEESKNFNKQYIKEQHEEGWMWRVPDFLSVCMQDFLHRWQPELRERKQIIITIVSVKLE